MSAAKKGKTGKCLHLPNARIGGLTSRRFSNRSVVLAALTGSVLVLLGLGAGPASADPAPNTQQCVSATGGGGTLCVTPSADSSTGMVSVDVEGTNLNTSVITGTITAGSYTDSNSMEADGPGPWFYSHTFTFTPPSGVTEGSVTLTAPPSSTFRMPADVFAWSFTSTPPPANHPPTAIADSVSTDENTAVPVDVLANDSDSDGDTLTVTGASGTSHGTTSIAANKVVYTPATDYVGTDSFTYTISDGHGGTASATVSVTVNQVVTPPTGDTPIAVITSSPVSELVEWFSGMGSFGGTPPLSYVWDFGDGQTSTAAAPGNHTFPAPGTYIVTLTVTDAAGNPPNVAKLRLELGPKVTLSATKGVRAGGKEKVAIAVTDTSGAVSGTKVAVQVTGKDTVSGTVTTNSAGRAIFTYRTHRAGKDKITATADGVSASTTVSILRPVERPTVHAASRKGVVNVTVLTSPRIAHHTVTVYRYHKVHGHWKWSRVGTAHTASNGRAHLALSLPHGKQRLRAIVSDKHYVERYSKVCSVQVQ